MAPAQSKMIPQERWGAFFEQLNSDFHGSDVTVELMAPDEQPVLLVYGQTLVEIRCDESVTIRLSSNVEHVVEHATEVRVEGDADGLGTVVLIEAAGGPPARLTLARPAQRAVGSSGLHRDGEDPAFVGGSARAAGGSVAAGDGYDARGIGDDYGPAITFGRSDDMGGVSAPGGGSFGDQDLSGRRSYDITADVYGDDVGDLIDDAGEGGGHAGPGSETRYSGAAPTSQAQGGNGPKLGHHRPDIIDGGSDQGVIDLTIDPVSGAPLDPANSDEDPYVEGEVGAQAERDLDDIEGESPERRPPRRGGDR